MGKFIQELREFKLSTVAVDNGTSVFLIAFMIILFGLKSYQVMPKEQYPEASLPKVYINTPYFGNSAEEIENLITRPIEQEVSSIVGLKNITSTCVQDFSVIIAEFDSDIDINVAVQKTKDAVDKAKAELPTDLDQEPEIFEVNFSELPIVTVNISGDYSMDDLRTYSEYIQDKLEDIPEISEAKMKGALNREIKINVDLLKMESVEISFMDIESAIANENITMSGGELINKTNRRAVRIVGQFTNLKEIEDLIVKSENQRSIYLKDIAKVEYGFEERKSYARAGVLPVISLDIIKRSGENLLSTAEKIKHVISEAQNNLPSGLIISQFNDLSVYTKNEVTNLENSIISGVILVILVLLFFLGLRNAVFVGIAIPLSMLTGILILNIFGVTMNIVVLFSLILALGLLVDNGIVVVENIYRYMQNGSDSTEAAKYGAGEVAWPIIASTATTLAAFLPLLFWPGIMGIFMQYMPITLIIVLCSSLFVALIINPVFTSRFMKVLETEKSTGAEATKIKTRKNKNALLGFTVIILFAALAHLGSVVWLRNLLFIGAILGLLNHFILNPLSIAFQNIVLPRLEYVYDKFIGLCLRGWNSGITLALTFFMLLAAFGLFTKFMPKMTFFPEADPLYVNIFVDLPIGSDIEATNNVMIDLEKKVAKVIAPYNSVIEAVLTQIGEDTSDPNTPPEPGLTPNKARMTVQFVEYKDRGEISTRKIMEEIRKEIKGSPGIHLIVDQNAGGPPVGKPINVEIKGDEIDSLLVLTDNLVKHINKQNIGGIEELNLDVELGKPEMIININRTAARKYGVSTGQVASAIRTSVFGTEASKFKVGEDEYPIVIRLRKESRNNISDLINQKITFRNQSNGKIMQVPISSVASFEYSSTYNAIRRVDSQRSITISSNVLDGYNANEVNAELEAILQDYSFPDDYTFAFTGEQQQQAEDMAFLSNAFLAALFLIFIILVTQFNSLISPFIIIITVLFSLIGVLLGYVISGQDFNMIFSGVGIISLAGIVVNNAIVLVDYINLLITRKRKELGHASMFDLSKDEVMHCIMQGGATRLRPVLLTAITTVLGLIPLAIGFNFNFFSFVSNFDPQFFIGGDNTAMWGPMAWTIIYGIVYATFLTLIVVPAMYWIAYSIKFYTKNRLQKTPT